MKKFLFVLLLLQFAVHISKAQPADTTIQRIMTNGHIPGTEAVLIKDGYWVYDHSWGDANIDKHLAIKRETIFMMASISKTIIATALMQLWERGAFKLDDNINNYLPFKVQNPHNPADTVTFRMLTDHTSAIQDNYTVLDGTYVYGDSPISLDTFLRNYFVPGGTYYSASSNFYYYHSGTRTNYSNIGATLAAYLVQRISGDDYSHYCDTAIFAKLCMDNTALKLAGLADTTLIAHPYRWTGTYYLDEGLYGYADYPDGQLRTNITALARFMTMYMQHGTYNGEKILNAATVDTMLTYQHSIFGQGIFFYQYLSNGDTLWGHTGGDAGVSTAMFFNMQKQIGGIVFCNGDGTATNNMQKIFNEVYKYGLTVTPAPTDTFPACHYVYTAVPTLVMNNEFVLHVYPNPATDILHIDVSGRTVNRPLKLTITNMVGALSQVRIFNSDNTSINTSGLPAGIYILRVEGDGQSQVVKFVKN